MVKETLYRPWLLLLPQLSVHETVPGAEAERTEQFRRVCRESEQHDVGSLPRAMQTKKSPRLDSLLNAVGEAIWRNGVGQK